MQDAKYERERLLRRETSVCVAQHGGSPIDRGGGSIPVSLGSKSRHTIATYWCSGKTIRTREAVEELNVVLRGSGVVLGLVCSGSNGYKGWMVGLFG